MIFPTSYFPPIFYFQKMVELKNVEISSEELFLKQTLRNRCEIATSNGIQRLSVPISKPSGSKSKTKDIIISNVQNWRKDHWKSIESAYQNAPYFHFYDKEIKGLIDCYETHLIDFNLNILNQFVSWWELPINDFVFTDNLMNESEDEIDYMSRKPIDKYIQVFDNRNSFISNLSVLDLLFCEGPMGRKWLI